MLIFLNNSSPFIFIQNLKVNLLFAKNEKRKNIKYSLFIHPILHKPECSGLWTGKSNSERVCR